MGNYWDFVITEQNKHIYLYFHRLNFWDSFLTSVHPIRGRICLLHSKSSFDVFVLESDLR